MARARYGVSHAAMLLRQGIEAQKGLSCDEQAAAYAALDVFAGLFNGDVQQPDARLRYEFAYSELGGTDEGGNRG